MALGGIDRLTEEQRECLRLVLTRRNSKEIGRELGISPYSVDKRIERAIAALSATSRFDAARMLALHEGLPAYEPFAHEPIDVAEPVAGTAPPLSTTPFGWGRRLFGLTPNERISGNARNNLTRLERLGLILALMAGIAVASGALLNIAATLASTLWRHSIDFSR